MWNRHNNHVLMCFRFCCDINEKPRLFFTRKKKKKTLGRKNGIAVNFKTFKSWFLWVKNLVLHIPNKKVARHQQQLKMGS